MDPIWLIAVVQGICIDSRTFGMLQDTAGAGGSIDGDFIGIWMGAVMVGVFIGALVGDMVGGGMFTI